MLEPVAHAGRRTRGDVGVQREPHRRVADRVGRDLEAGAGEVLDRAREPLRIGPERLGALAVRVRLLQPRRAAVDHAVGEELHDAAAPQPPAHVAQADLRLHLLVARLRRLPQRHAQAQAQLVGALEVAQEVDTSPARRPSRARRSARACSAAAAARRSARAARASAGAARRAGSAPARSSRAARRSARRARRRRPPSDPGRRARPSTCASSSARGVASAVWRSESRTNAAAPSTAAVIASTSGARVVVEPPGEQPAAVDGARGQRREHLFGRLAPAQVHAAGQLRAPERVQVGVGEPGDQRLPAGVQHLGARVAVGAHLGFAADRDDRPVRASRPRSRTAGPDRASGSARRRSRGQRPCGFATAR